MTRRTFLPRSRPNCRAQHLSGTNLLHSHWRALTAQCTIRCPKEGPLKRRLSYILQRITPSSVLQNNEIFMDMVHQHHPLLISGHHRGRFWSISPVGARSSPRTLMKNQAQTNRDQRVGNSRPAAQVHHMLQRLVHHCRPAPLNHLRLTTRPKGDREFLKSSRTSTLNPVARAGLRQKLRGNQTLLSVRKNLTRLLRKYWTL